MSIFDGIEAVRDWVSLGVDNEVGNAMTVADMLGEGAAAGYDALTGDNDHAEKHLGNIANDAFSFALPKDVNNVLGVHDAKEATENFATGAKDDDPGGSGAKWGGMLGMGLGFGLPGLLAGGLLGGYLGDSENQMQSTGVGAGAMGSALGGIGSLTALSGGGGDASKAEATHRAFGHYAD